MSDTIAIPLPPPRAAFTNINNKRKSSPTSSTTSITKRKESPLRDAIRRTPVELVSAEVLRQTAAQMLQVEREIQSLLEPDYRDDVKSYMFDMEVSSLSLFSFRGRVWSL